MLNRMIRLDVDLRTVDRTVVYLVYVGAGRLMEIEVQLPPCGLASSVNQRGLG